MDNEKVLLKIIKGEPACLDMIPQGYLIEQMEKKGITKNSAEKTIEQLTKEGKIKSPRKGFIAR